MSEYIERESVLEIVNEFDRWTALVIGRKICNLPIADVVPVVRCKDCKYHNKPRLGWCSFHLDRENSDDFCSRGKERIKENG